MPKYTTTVLLVTLVLGAIFSYTDSVQAMVVKWGETSTFEPYTTTDEDLYVVGETVSMQGTSTQDVLAVGSSVTQGGVVGEDGLYIGGVVNLDGVIGGDVRGAGGKLHVTGTIEEDLVFAGGTVIIEEGAFVQGDILVFGELVIIDGVVHGAVKAYARTVMLKGQVDGSLDIRATEAVSIVDDARIIGDFTYSAPREAFVSETASIEGEVHFSKTDRASEQANPILSGATMALILMTVISALTILYLFPAQTKRITNVSLTKGMFLHGIYALLLLLGVPIISVLLMLSVIGIVPGIVMLFGYVTIIGVAFSIAPVIASVLLVRLYKKEEKAFEPAWVSLGAILFALLVLVPFLGWLVRFIIFLLALYAIFAVLHESLWLPRRTVQEGLTSEVKEESHEEKENNETSSTEETEART